jgi:hypothetical protein
MDIRCGKIRLALAAAIASAALATPAVSYAQDVAGKPVCLDVSRIDHTEVLNDHQILFFMNGRKVWINNLTTRCATLTRQDGWAWSSRIPQYCDNVETIRVLRTGEVCLLGAFTPYQKPA